MIQLQDLRDAGDAFLEIAHLFEIRAQLDERRGAEAALVDDELAVLEAVQIRLHEHEVRAGLDGQEAAARHVDAVGVFEVPDGGPDRRFQLDDVDVGFALFVGRDGFVVGDDFHLELVVFHHALDGFEVEPDVVGVEVFEFLDRFELVRVFLGDLRDLEQAHGAFVVDDGAAFDVGFGLVGQFHDVLGFGLDHVLQDAQVDDGTEVVGVGEEKDFDAALDELVEDAGVVKRLEDVSVSRRVPV